MIVREETSSDMAAVRDVVSEAFGQPIEADLVEALNAAGDSVISLVAEADEAIVGHVLFSKLQAPNRSLALAPVAVRPERQNQGIGATLINEGLARAKLDGWHGVFVLGEPDYYRRFGFELTPAEGFETSYPRDYFMALELKPDGLKGQGGPVVYAPAFLALED